jgi:hypothetical protein
MDANVSSAQQASLALSHLRALDAALRTIPRSRNSWSSAMALWTATRAEQIQYDEPGGRWMIRRQTILEVHDRFRNAAISDEIAWFVVVNGLPGECEGYLACYLEQDDLLQGEYLRREPNGAYVDVAIETLAERADQYRAFGGNSVVLEPQQCPNLLASLASLNASVNNSNGDRGGRARLLEMLAEIRRRCP